VNDVWKPEYSVDGREDCTGCGLTDGRVVLRTDSNKFKHGGRREDATEIVVVDFSSRSRRSEEKCKRRPLMSVGGEGPLPGRILTRSAADPADPRPSDPKKPK
jgi:hypothetical protein